MLAHEDAHETAGRHTCDKRLSRSALAAQFPAVDYGLVSSEDDPLWDETARETHEQLAARVARFVAWLMGARNAGEQARPCTARRVVVAAHSGMLLTAFNAVLEFDGANPEDTRWFGTGEMRTVMLTFESRET